MKDIFNPQWDEFHDPDIVNWKRVRSSIEHENLLTNHRFTWLLTSQGFLFTGFFFVWKATLDAKPGSDAEFQIRWILTAIIVTGLLMSLHLTLGLRAAHRQHNALEEWWATQETAINRHPPICGKDPTIRRGIPYYFLAIVFAFAWVIFGLITYFHLIEPHKDAISKVIPHAGTALVTWVLLRIFSRRKAQSEKPK